MQETCRCVAKPTDGSRLAPRGQTTCFVQLSAKFVFKPQQNAEVRSKLEKGITQLHRCTVQYVKHLIHDTDAQPAACIQSDQSYWQAKQFAQANSTMLHISFLLYSRKPAGRFDLLPTLPSPAPPPPPPTGCQQRVAAVRPSPHRHMCKAKDPVSQGAWAAA